jgi:hypothetical protein
MLSARLSQNIGSVPSERCNDALKKTASKADSLSIRSNENQCSSSLLTQAVSLDKI